MLLERLNLKACSKQINHKMSKHFSILSKLWCNSNKQSKCVTDAIPLLLEYGKISKLYNIQMRNEGLCTKTGLLNCISDHLTRLSKKLLHQDLQQVYQNWSERHLTVFCINPNDLALLFITSISVWQSSIHLTIAEQ